jgi:competence/damage-inducible protein CinA-like protein
MFDGVRVKTIFIKLLSRRRMPTAELITIGTELLLGEIQDTNTRYLAKQLKNANIDLFRITMIGDNAQRIATLVNEALSRSDIVITTGGLGPTVDDPTRDALALAFQTHTEFHPELWQEIEQRFLRRGITPTENNRRQAYLPEGAEVIHNPVGTAPAFFQSNGNKIVICLPGVPREMETLTETEVIPLLKNKYQLQGIIKPRVIHLAGIGESVVDDAIGDFEKLTNPTVGLLAHPGIVDIRITAKSSSENEADQMITEIEQKILALFPDKVFGFDDDTLANAVLALAKEKQTQISIASFGLADFWPKELTSSINKSISLTHLPQITSGHASHFNSKNFATIQAECLFTQASGESKVEISLYTRNSEKYFTSLYNGPSAQGSLWAINLFLEHLRQFLINLDSKKGIE